MWEKGGGGHLDWVYVWGCIPVNHDAEGVQWDCKCIPVNAQGDQWDCTVSWDWPGVQQDCVGVCVCVWETYADLAAGSFFYILYFIFCILYNNCLCCISYSITSGWSQVAHGGSGIKCLPRTPKWKGPLNHDWGWYTVCLKWDRNMLVGCHGSILCLGTRVEVVRGGAGPGRPIAEAHDHDMTNTGTGKSGCVVKH